MQQRLATSAIKYCSPSATDSKIREFINNKEQSKMTALFLCDILSSPRGGREGATPQYTAPYRL